MSNYPVENFNDTRLAKLIKELQDNGVNFNNGEYTSKTIIKHIRVLNIMFKLKRHREKMLGKMKYNTDVYWETHGQLNILNAITGLYTNDEDVNAWEQSAEYPYKKMITG